MPNSNKGEIEILLREKKRVLEDERISVTSRKARLKAIDKRIKVLENGNKM